MPFTDEAYGPVYYPAAPSLSAAQALQIRPGETLRADFAVQAYKAYKIRGVLRNPRTDLQPSIRLLRGDDAVGGRVLISRSSQMFEVNDVTPGSYTLQAYTAVSNATLFGETPVTVGEGDVSGVEVVMGAGVELKGTIQFSTAITGSPRRRFVTVRARNSNPDHSPVSADVSSRAVDDAGNFTLDNLFPGVYTITVSEGAEYLASAWAGSNDVLDGGLVIGAAAPADALTIVLSGNGGQIEGKVAGVVPGVLATVVAVRRYGSSIFPLLYP